MNNKEWFDDATLYQPYEAEQILLAEQASCLSVKAYLNMCNLPYQIQSCSNAEFMSPGGRLTKLPFLKVGAFVVAEFEPIVAFVEQKGYGIGKWMDEDEKADMRTYVSLVENVLSMAEIHTCFVDEEVYGKVTAPRYGCTYPWPLSVLQNYLKRKNALRLLKVYQWNNMSTEHVVEKVEKCCESLVYKLEENQQQYFYSSEPCELDAIAFGHLFTILTTKLPDMTLAHTVQKFKPLVEFCRSIDEKYFSK